MTYSVDLRKKVLKFVQNGGSKAEASRLFGVARSCVYDWLSRKDLRPKKQGRRKRKLDWAALERHIEEHPDLLLRERAAHFGVRMYSLQYACTQMRISHKKNLPLRRKKR